MWLHQARRAGKGLVANDKETSGRSPQCPGVTVLTTNIWWARRDLRLADNQALSAASDRAERLIPVFVLDPGILSLDHS